MENRKKHIFNEWAKEFPYLKAYKTNKLMMTLDICAIGLELKGCQYGNYYQPTFNIYPLWKEDNKRNFSGTILTQEIDAKRHSQYHIPYQSHDYYFTDAVTCTKSQVGAFLCSHVSAQKLVTHKFRIISQFTNQVFQADLREFWLYVARYIDDIHLIKEIIRDIEKVSKQWKLPYFYKDCSVEEWKQEIYANIDNWNEITDRIHNNMEDKEIAKLNKAHFFREEVSFFKRIKRNFLNM